MKHAYYVVYTIHSQEPLSAAAPRTMQGSCGIERDTPIASMQELQEIAVSIAQQWGQQARVVPGTNVTCIILNWIPFERRIALVNELPRLPAA